MDSKQMLHGSRQLWDKAAETFDELPDQGLRDPDMRQAWTTLLASLLPPAPATVLDIGCGTGSLSIIMAELGYSVTGIDWSPEMLIRAKNKATNANQSILFENMDASALDFSGQQFDAMVCRHLLWSLSQPSDILKHWANLLLPSGQLILIEGYWFTDVGLRSQDILWALPAPFVEARVEKLSHRQDLWGGMMTDERYAIIASK